MNPHYRWEGRDLRLWVHVQPRASRDEIVGLHGEALKVRITAPPVDGKANKHLGQFLAKAFGVSKGAVELVSGETGRDKQFLIHDPGRIPAEAKIETKSAI